MSLTISAEVAPDSNNDGVCIEAASLTTKGALSYNEGNKKRSAAA